MAGEMVSPQVKRIRAYFAPVNRVAQQATIFDPAQSGSFALQAPPAPWIDLGWVSGFTRSSGTSVVPLKAGSPASAHAQVRTDVEATVKFTFESWGKLQLSLAAGTQQMNLLATQAGAAAAGSGGVAAPAVAVASGSTATSLQLGAAATAFQAGSLVAVDVDYGTGVTGFVGSGVSGAYVRTALQDLDYVRRVTLNVARIASVDGGVLTLESPLLAGVPTTNMKVSPLNGFCDREGSTFFQEWSGLFVGEGQQGERVLWYYPRLQVLAGIREELVESSGAYQSVRLAGSFRALPIKDPVDGESVLCFRSYIAAV